MTDVFSPEKRREIMSKIRSKNTTPERHVRSILHHMGFRFRIHVKSMPGTPDIVLRKYGKVIFVHGCFWHGHKGCQRSQRPKTNLSFWLNKIESNIQRDKRNIKALTREGWKCLVIWECQLRNIDVLKQKFIRFIHG